MEQIGKCGAAVRAIAIGVVFPPLGVFGERPVTQADLAFGWAHLDDLELHLFAKPETVLEIRPDRIIEFGNVAQAFDPFLDFDENSEWRMPHNPCRGPCRPADGS